MFKVTKISNDRLDLELSGKLDSEAMKIALDEFSEKAAEIVNGKMLYAIIDFHLPSFGAMIVEFSRLPAMFGLIRKFDRAAVLTDISWLQKASEIEGALLPGLEIKAFKLDQVTEAEVWLNR